jgi:hypothetical protein
LDAPSGDFDLRGEVIYVLTVTANVRAQYKELRDSPGVLEELDLSDDDRKQLRDARISFREMASRMTAFAKTSKQKVLKLISGRFRERRQLMRPHFNRSPATN